MSKSEQMISQELRTNVENNLSRDPVAIALDRNIANAALVASQVKYLKRAEHKLPSFYAARCIIPSLAFEQSSSEQTAARKNFSGELCIDLTCGLGVDSFHLSKKFDRIISVERNPELALIARENFRRLGVGNIEVVNTSAEEFLAGFDGSAELIYVDPDRRSVEGRKLVRVEDCSPNILGLKHLIDKVSPRLVVKLSPMFDVNEVFRVFGRHTLTEVVSLGAECKEVIAEVSDRIENPVVRAVAIGLGEVEYPFESDRDEAIRDFEPEKYNWLVIADVSLQKSRLAQRYLSERIDYIDSDNGYGFAVEKPENIMGRVFAIKAIEPFDPKRLKGRLKNGGIGGVDIMRRRFPISAADIAQRIGVAEGGVEKMAFTKIGGKLWQISLLS